MLLGVIIVLLFILTFAGTNTKIAKYKKNNSIENINITAYEYLVNSCENDTQIISIIEKLKNDSLNKNLIDSLIIKSKEKNIKTANAYGYYLKGIIEKNSEILLQAADMFLELSGKDSTENANNFYSTYGIKSCDFVLSFDTKNIQAMTRKASFLIYLKNETMPGVKLLKDVEKIDSNNIEAHHLLMILAIQSNQYEKAVKRLKKLISLQPQNTFYKELLLKIETQQLK